MYCKYLKFKTKDYKKYKYCSKNKQKIEKFECEHCKDKSYKEYKQLKRTALKKKTHKVSRVAKACDIPIKVKIEVWERDSHCCIFCGKLVPVYNANAHFIPRSANGLGIKENIFTACNECHGEQDNGLHTKEYDLKAEEYLRKTYGSSWNKEKLIYKKYN